MKKKKEEKETTFTASDVERSAIVVVARVGIGAIL